VTGVLLVIGATGFAGRHLAEEAQSADWEVVPASRDGREGARVDLLDPDSIGAALREHRPDAIANLAGAASVAESWEDPDASFRANAAGVDNLMGQVAEHAPDARLLVISSGDVYGEVPAAELPIVEDRPLRPLNPYAKTKAAMEDVCERYRRSSGLEITVARAFNHVGPGQSDRFAASSFARQVAEAELRGEDAVTLLVGDLGLRRDFCDVRDTVRAYRLLLERGTPGAYNVCAGRPTAIGELIEMIDAATPLTIETSVDEARLRPGEPQVVYGSHGRLTAATGWRPERALADALADLLEWWRGRLAR
jgi:GDP-4-dehydro-6-deoxy-D-mannose reductase